MLEPGQRILLLDALRPPAGFAFDRAVGTTFTLDLHALLTAPLALAAFDWESGYGSVPDDPVALLESLRRCASHIDLFCQAGEIALPPSYHRLYTWLEGSIHEVAAPAPGAVFHPKVWVLRYRSVDEPSPAWLRVLCSSRNLTFDRSWDTLLVLDGQAGDGSDEAAAPLAAFLRSLLGRAARPLSRARRSAISALADEVATARFNPPEGFSDIRFHVLGGRGGGGLPFPAMSSRLLAVSPFLTAGGLERLLAAAGQIMLVSRAEEMDRLPIPLLERVARRLALNPAAVPADMAGTDSDEQAPGELGEPTAPNGLHAKLYVAESDREAVWFTGSANATTAGFGGNIEVLVELRGRRATVGINAILGSTEDGLLRLLQDHPLPSAQALPTAEEQLALALDAFRRQVAATAFLVTVGGSTAAGATDRYNINISGGALPSFADGSATVAVRPLSLPGAQTVPLGEPFTAAFGPVALESVTPFVVVEVTARRLRVTQTERFVVRATLEGGPSDRADRTLASILATRHDVLRYLLFLLADAGGPPPGGWMRDLQRLVERAGATGDGEQESLELPLLETLVRIAAREPARLEPVQRLVDALGRTEEGRALLPSGFEDVWPAIWASRVKQASR